jgi:hypothetical protein
VSAVGATLDDAAAAALALPATVEVLTWGDERTFRTRGKIFVMGNRGGASVSIRTSVTEQRELVASDPGTFRSAPYVGRFGWTSVQLSNVDAGELRELIVEAWRRAASKTVVRACDADHASESTR